MDAMQVSIVIPAYNAADSLGEALSSLLSQTYRDWEAIVVDDGSCDGTRAIADRFAARDPRFQVLAQPNQGVSAARNAAIARARYDWLLFLDADDWIMPSHLERMTLLLRDDSLDAAYCGWAYVAPDGRTVLPQLPQCAGDLFALHADRCAFVIHAYVVRKSLVEAVGGFDHGLRVCEDWDLWQRIARMGARFGALPEMLAPCRIRAGSASMDGARILSDGLRVLRQGHAPDPRVPRQHPVYRNGLPPEGLEEKEFYLLCSAAGLVLGQGGDARPLLESFSALPVARLEPYTVADCLAEAAMFSASRPLREWDSVWAGLEERAATFLDALERASGRTNLARRALRAGRYLTLTYMAEAGAAARAHALQARARLLPLKLPSRLRSGDFKLRRRVSRSLRAALTLVPPLAQAIRYFKRRHRVPKERAFFELVFSRRADPWNYGNTYEQLKYHQTLEMIPEGPVVDALELACAEGHFTIQLATRVQRLVATDVSEVALQRAARRCRHLDNVRFQRLDLTRDPLPGAFDLVVCSEVLYYTNHKSRLRNVARKLARALRPGGYLLMAHGNLVVDEPSEPGFDWDHPFGARTIGEIFGGLPELSFMKELRTPLYRIQLFRRELAKPTRPSGPGPAVVINGGLVDPLPEHVASQVFWNGRAERVPILLYHRIAPAGGEALSTYRVSPDAFESQLSYLRHAGFHSIDLEGWRGWVEHNVPLPKGALVLTFDDGYRDFMEHAWPLLSHYGFSACVYLVGDAIGQDNHWDRIYGERVPLLSWREIRRLQAEGVSFGSHGSSHRSLPTLSLREVIHELRKSKEILENGLGTPIHSFAYPYGETNRRVQYLVGVSGYELGLSCRPGACTTRDSLLALPRIEVAGTEPLESFVARLDPLAAFPQRSTPDMPPPLRRAWHSVDT